MMYTCVYIYIHIYVYIHIHLMYYYSPEGALTVGARARPKGEPPWMGTPSPPTKSLGFRGFDSSKLFILKGGNSHVRRIL